MHLGDITKISGYSAPIVDCIIGGSPCQDLSVAGKRAGLDGERSGLYIDQVRIVKEMRKRDELNGRSGVDVRPRYMVWENVPGAFSSNKGEDFRIVLEEIAKVCDKDAVIPMPDKGKWTNHGCILGDGWSVAWRVLDAQFWGVPQRRRRIALVADFGGHSAPEILFVSKGVSGNTDEGEQKREATPSDASGSIGADDCERGKVALSMNWQAAVGAGLCVEEELTNPLSCTRIPAVSVPYTMQDREGCSGGGKGALIQEDKSASLRTNNFQYVFQPVCFPQQAYDKYIEDDVGTTIKAMGGSYGGGSENLVCYTIDQGGGKSSVDVKEGKAPTLTTTHDGAPAVCYGINGDKAGTLDSSYYKGCGMRGGVEREVVAQAYGFDPSATRDVGQYFLEEKGNVLVNGTCPGPHNGVCIKDGTRYIVRRLTPLECERLQGYPDGWTDIGEWTDSNGKKKQTSDAARYKALGNSIALPPWKWVLKRLCACYERDATMASLFDGIGGFPYLWEQLNGKGSCLWASEIEDFPMAVTKVRIGE